LPGKSMKMIGIAEIKLTEKEIGAAMRVMGSEPRAWRPGWPAMRHSLRSRALAIVAATLEIRAHLSVDGGLESRVLFLANAAPPLGTKVFRFKKSRAMSKSDNTGTRLHQGLGPRGFQAKFEYLLKSFEVTSALAVVKNYQWENYNVPINIYSLRSDD
jgi:hypothetical protein